jgi:hypothetical protein
MGLVELLELLVLVELVELLLVLESLLESDEETWWPPW